MEKYKKTSNSYLCPSMAVPAHYLHILHQRLDQYRPPEKAENLYEPVRYIIALGGKRLRPALALMAAESYGGKAESALGPAMAVEWFHNFSLLHDDIMDQAPLRRGKPAAHKRYSVNAAILSGDVMLVDAFRFLQEVDPELLPDLLRRFSEMAVEVCQGQQLDMDFEQQLEVRKADYLEMIRLKTAVLLGFSLFAGARCGGADSDRAAALAEFGEQLGMAFQLRDDWLDTYGNPEQVGKNPGGDIMQDKKTYLFIHAYNNASASDQALLRSWMGRAGEPEQPVKNPGMDSGALPPKVKAVKEIYERSGAGRAVREAIAEHHQMALEALSRAGLKPEAQDSFRALAEALLERTH